MPPRFLLCLALLLGTAPAAPGVTVAPAETAEVSLAVVEGRPAIAWVDGPAGMVKYVRALDANGTAWGTPVTVAAISPVSLDICLRTVSGNPAVCYYDGGAQGIRFARANDTTGSVWGAPFHMPATALARMITMEIVAGNPAIAFQSGGSALMYLRAATPDGSAWPPAIQADVATERRDLSMKVVEGNPAIACVSLSHVLYTRALDPAGTSWGSLIPVAAEPLANFCSMQIVGGHPAISFTNLLAGRLSYVRAISPDGAYWPASGPVTMSSGIALHFQPSLAVVQGTPAIAFYSSSPFLDLKYLQAGDITGDTATAWSAPPLTLDSTGDTGRSPSLLEVNGQPAVAYVDTTQAAVKYLRATGGDSLWPADIVVQDATGAIIPRGGILPVGAAAVGSSRSINAALSNPNSGSGNLNITGMSIDGPDAAEFSILTSPATPLAGERSTQFRIQYTPAAPGHKTATLHVNSDAGISPGSYDMTLTGDTVPDISVERPGGGVLTDGATLFLPVIAEGGAGDFTFTVRNPGGAELNSLAVTVDGPDQGEFFIPSAPASVLAPGAATTFTLRLATVTGGAKTGVVHLASNVSGSKNPFDIISRMEPGRVDESFQSAIGMAPVTALALRPGGGILTTGLVPLGALSAGGSVDTAFFQPAIANLNVYCIAMQKDRKILIGGILTSVDGQPRRGLARLSGDGALDTTFLPEINATVKCMAVQPDGKIITGGFTMPGGGNFPPWMARFHADGSLDASFAPHPDGNVECLALQADGRILAGGSFTAIDGKPARGIARLHPNGTLDESFAGSLASTVTSLALMPDGKILAGSALPPGIARLLPNGTRDASMTLTVDRNVLDLALQADGKCLMAGEFNTISQVTGRQRIARIKANGELDESFAPQVEGSEIRRLALQEDGRVLIGGKFSKVGNLPHVNLARLENEPAVTFLQAFGGSTIRWLRGGAAPEVSDVTLDVKPDGASDWIRLGTAARMPGGWQLTGLTLPASGSLRAQGRAGPSVVESVVPVLTTIEYWRLQHFNTSANTGDAADDADPDHDGLTNLIEFAFALPPGNAGGHPLPAFQRGGGSFTAAFTAPEGREDVEYRAEWSDTMLHGTWTEIPDTGTGETHEFSVLGDGGRMFVRFGVRVP